MGTRTPEIELTTSISNLRHLRDSALEPYDAIYLGNIYCRQYEDNLLEHPARLAEAVALVRAAGRRAYVATYAAPRADALPVIRRALEAARAAGAAGAEAHSLGVLRILRTEFPELPVHVGSFANVYTEAGARTLAAHGVARLQPSHELGLGEIRQLATTGGVPLEVVVHGKAPLGVSETCILLEHETRWGVGCPDLCQLEVFLEKEDDWGLKSVGKGILGGRDLCLLESLGALLACGLRHFRIEAVSESPAYREEVGRIYRQALERAGSGDTRLDPSWWEVLRRHARLGLANGFAFGRSGMLYVGPGDPARASAP